MKKIFLIVIAIVATSLTVSAQKSLKFAHVDVQAIFGVMPEKEAATKEVEEHAKALEDQMQTLYKAYEEKANDYKANAENWSELIRQDKEEEIMSLQNRIQTFQVQAQEDLAKKEESLLEPIRNRILEAIKQIGDEQGFTYIVDVATLLYKSSDSVDITQDVKTKLNIK